MGRPHGIWILNDSTNTRQETRQAFIGNDNQYASNTGY